MMEKASFSVKPPAQLLKEFDEAIEGYYTTRNSAICDLMRRYIQEKKEAS